MNNQIEIIARVFIVCDRRVLLCQAKEKDHFFFPGGHVELGETIAQALKREIKEEINEELTDISFLGVLENTYSDRSDQRQEINIIFEGRVGNTNINSIEDHLAFSWIETDKLQQTNIKPEMMKNIFSRWLAGEKKFYECN